MKKVAIYGQPYAITAKAEIVELVDVLLSYDVDILFEQKYFSLLNEIVSFEKDFQTFSSYYDLSSDYDAMFTIGGDGTFLRGITYVRDLDIPIIGINAGRLGFLATICKNEITSSVKKIVNGDYQVKERSLLEVSTTPEFLGELNIALNEVTIARKNTTSMIGIKTYIDNQYLTNYWADGLIISTPTGSTGYSLSCNGPVILPECKSLVLNPIAPHNLNSRPMIINDDMVIDLDMDSREGEYLLTMDSRVVSLKVGVKVCVKKADFTVKVLVFSGHSFLGTLRDKLLWGEDTRNESVY